MHLRKPEDLENSVSEENRGGKMTEVGDINKWRMESIEKSTRNWRLEDGVGD